MRIAIALLFAAALAQAQVRETMTVEVVEVPVYVHAPDGTPIRGLTKDAFQLFVDGKPQAIDYFDVMDFETPPAQGQARVPVLHSDMRVRRLYLFLFDFSAMPPRMLARTKEAAKAAVARSNPATDYFAVATYTPREGVRFVIPFIGDRAAIAGAITTLDTRDSADPLGISTSPKLIAAHDASTQGTPLALDAARLGLSGEDKDKIVGGEVNQESSKELLRHRARDQMFNFGELAARLAAMEGQKHVVFLSGGFSPGLWWDRGTPAMSPDLRAMARAFIAAGAVLDSIDVVGNRPARAEETLYRLSEATGGDVITSGNDIAGALARLAKSQEVVYLLGFHRRGNKADGAIDVRVSGVPRRTTIAFRKGYAAPPARGQLDALQLADIVLNDIPQHGLSAKLDVDVTGDGADVTMRYSPAEVAAQRVAEKPWLEAMLYIFDDDGKAALYQAGRIPIGDAMGGAFHKKIALPPGHYTAKLLLNVDGTQSAGFARAEFDVPPK